MTSPARAVDLNAAEPLTDAVVLVVEGPTDQQIVLWLLEAAGYPVNRVQILTAQGKRRVAEIATRMSGAVPGRVAVLVDLDEQNVPDARERAREQLGDPAAEVFCAVPTAEAWLFADDRAALAAASESEELRRILEHSLPEDLPDPKQLAHQYLGLPWKWSFLRQIDIGRAAARSPSLRVFLEGLGRLLDFPAPHLLAGVAHNISRDIVSGLIREVSPAAEVIWRTSDGCTYTAAELQRHIEAGDEIGRQYASDLLRVARDFLRRAANRPR
jgi:hypothetical protein